LKAVVYCTWMEGGVSRVRYDEEMNEDGTPRRCRLPELVLGNVKHEDVIEMLTRPGNSQIVWFDTLEATTQRPIRVYVVNSSRMMTIQKRGAEKPGFTNALWDLASGGGADMSVNTRKVLGEINSLGVLEIIGVDPRPTGNMVSVSSTAVVHSLEDEIARRVVSPPEGTIDVTLFCAFRDDDGELMVVKNTGVGDGGIAFDRLPRMSQVTHADVVGRFAESVDMGTEASAFFFQDGVNPGSRSPIWVYVIMLSRKPLNMEAGAVVVRLSDFLNRAAEGGVNFSVTSTTTLRKIKHVNGFRAIGVPPELVPAEIVPYVNTVVIPVGCEEVVGAYVAEPRFNAVVYYTYTVYGGWYVRVERVNLPDGGHYTRLPRMQNIKHSQALVKLGDSGRNTDIAWFDTGDSVRVYVVHGIRPLVLGDAGDNLERVSELWRLVSENSQYISQGSRELLGQMASLQVFDRVGVPGPVPNTYKPTCTSEGHVLGAASVLGKRSASMMATLFVFDRFLKILDGISL